VTVSLRGQGVQWGLQLTPNPVDFNFVQGGQSRTLTVQVTNVGYPDIAVTAVSLSPVGDGGVAAFSLSAPAFPPGGTVLPSGGSLQLAVTFSPPPCELEKFVASLEIAAGGAVVAIPLVAYEGGAVVTCTPLELNFGVVACGGVPTSIPIICTNTGTDVLGSDAGPAAVSWSWTSSAPDVCQAVGPDAGTLQAGQWIEFDVSCTCPPGYDGGAVTITLTGPLGCANQTQTFTVSGVCDCP
jgi:hypothetical protein